MLSNIADTVNIQMTRAGNDDVSAVLFPFLNLNELLEYNNWKSTCCEQYSKMLIVKLNNFFTTYEI